MQIATAVQWSIAIQARFVASYFMCVCRLFLFDAIWVQPCMFQMAVVQHEILFFSFLGTLGLREKAMLDTWLGYQNKLVVRAS